MAVPSPGHVPGTSTHSRLVDHVPRPRSSPRSLPAGGCRFTSLDHDISAATCGCQRFFLRIDRSAGLDNEWCMCGHHSCFHLRVNENEQSSLTSQVDDGEVRDLESYKLHMNQVLIQARHKLVTGSSCRGQIRVLSTIGVWQHRVEARLLVTILPGTAAASPKASFT
jgi:hypothetical protein